LLIPPTKAVDLGDGTYAVAAVMETSQDRGIATGGSTTTCIDTTKAWIVNHFIGDAIEVTVAGVEYHSLITANTANTITMDVIGAVVVAGDPYKIISAVGAASTIADGADVTQGAIADAAVVAGAAGTLSAKLRRLTTDLSGVLLDTADIEVATEAINVALQAGGITQTQLAAIVAAQRSAGVLLNSGVLAADTQVKASAGNLYWLSVSDTANLAIEINDSVGGAGVDVWGIDLPAAGYAHLIFDPPIECANGIYLDVSTVTCKATIGYI